MKMSNFVLLAFCLALFGCGSTIKTAEYNFYQGVPQQAVADTPAVVQSGRRGASNPTVSPTVGGASGQGNNTIVVFDVSSMDAEADGALGTQGASAATGAMQDVLSKWTTDLRQTDSNNPAPVTTTTTTTTTPPVSVVPVNTDPTVPVDPGQGEFEEVQ